LKKIILILIFLYACNQPNAYIGHQYIGAKYTLDPLGENKKPDKDPLMRVDAFDCTTFVETSLADGDVNKLNSLRYKNAQIDFLNRNHFIETDWLNNNSDKVENVSNLYAKTDIRTVIIDKQTWFKKVHNIDVNIPKQTILLEYIPYKNIQTIKVTEPMIILFISGNSKKCDTIGTDLAVVHMGFILPNGKLRHASSKYKHVLDESFDNYIKQRAQDKNALGISLVRIK